MLTRAVVSFNAKGGGGETLGSGPQQIVHRSVFPTSGVLAGTGPIAFLANGSAGFDDGSNTWTISGDTTHYSVGWAGSHDLGAGLSVQRRQEESLTVFANDGFAQEHLVLRDPSNPSAGMQVFQRDTFEPARFATTLSRSYDVAFYVRDNWRLSPKLTFNLGLRADVIRRFDRLFDVDTQRSVELGPRLGATYALTVDGRSVARASWGRVHDALSTNTIPVGDDSPAMRRAYDVNPRRGLRDRARGAAVDHAVRS